MPGVALKASNCWSMFDLSTNEWSTLRTECTFQTCSQIMHCKYMLQQTEFVTQNPQNIIRITHKKNNFYQTTKLIPSQNRPLDSSAMHQAHRLSSLQLCTDTDWMTETRHNIWKNLRKLIFFYSCDHTMKKSNKTPLKLIKGNTLSHDQIGIKNSTNTRRSHVVKILGIWIRQWYPTTTGLEAPTWPAAQHLIHHHTQLNNCHF